jgi:chromosomal replication initiator protein
VISGLFTIPIARRADSFAGEAAFIAGPENALVRSVVAAVRSAESAAVSDGSPTDTFPGTSSGLAAVSPLVLYGPSGVGKSTLAHLLADERRCAANLAQCVTTTGLELAQALGHAADTNSVDELRNRFHQCDLLLVDDVDELAGREAAQQFLCTTIDALLDRRVLILVTARVLPVANAALSPQLASRLASGLVVPLVPPEGAARQALVEQFAREFSRHTGQRLDPARLERLAARRGPGFATAPQLRQAVMQMAADQAHAAPARESSRTSSPRGKSAASDHKPLLRHITSAVARHEHVTVAELKGKSRLQHLAHARSLAMTLCRRLSSASYAEIGRFFGNRDHTTVLHACQKIESLAQQDSETSRVLADLALQISTMQISTTPISSMEVRG